MKRRDNIFATTMVPPVVESRFDLGHDVKVTFEMGELVPICLMEALPGDTFDLNYVNLIRFAPLASPVMHKFRVKTEYFFVPNRILFSSWEDFITGVGSIGWPFARIDGELPIGSLGDYLGVPPGDYSAAPLNVSALPFAGYARIFDDWYRDQNLILEKGIDDLIPGNNVAATDIAFATPFRRAWEHDYFTSCLPTPNQGAEVDLPLTFQDDIPVELNTASRQRFVNSTITGGFVDGDLGSDATGNTENLNSNVAGWLNPNGSMTVDVQSDAATINDLREAWTLQSFLERSLRGGLRYFEQMWSHFHQKSPDARLQRTELIGSNVQVVSIGEVLATARNEAEGVDVGSLGGHGISVGGSDRLSYHCEEHGFIFGIVSVVPDSAYQDGLAKMFSRADRLDYAWPDFAALGEQAVLRKEVMALADLPYDRDAVFGYLPRYSEYRYQPSRVAGDFRDSLAFWTAVRQFDASAPPLLNEEFVTCVPDNRIFSVVSGDVDHIFCQVINAHNVVRKLPRYGVPATIG